MTTSLKSNFYAKLPSDKIKINWNKNPIKMGKFLSFLTVDVVRSHDHLGSTTGWTRLDNKELKLVIGGGMVGNVEYLDTIQYGEKLDNRFNNYVNPFYLFDILTKEGQKFFLDYYKNEIEAIVTKQRENVEYTEHSLEHAKCMLAEIEAEVLKLESSIS